MRSDNLLQPYTPERMEQMHTILRTTLDQEGILSEFASRLTALWVHDVARVVEARPWLCVIRAVQHVLGADEQPALSFHVAWLVMYAAISRLDELQDGDTVGDSSSVDLPANLQYHEVFSYYLLATCFLNALTHNYKFASVEKVHRLWSQSMLRMAAGQYGDLLSQAAPGSARSLQHYQSIAQAKTGATFALAFGGAGILSSQDHDLIQRLQAAGEIYGALLQFADDVEDTTIDSAGVLSFPVALTQAMPISADRQNVEGKFLDFVIRTYLQHVEHILKPVALHTRTGILSIFQETFGSLLVR